MKSYLRLTFASLALATLISPATAQNAKPSFDCATARGGAELAICRNAKLARLDREIARVYGEIVADLDDGTRQVLRDDQRAFIATRNVSFQASRDVEELDVLLKNRRDFLQRVLDNREGSDAREGYFESDLGLLSVTRSGKGYEITIQTAGPGGRWICEATVPARETKGRLTGRGENGLSVTVQYADGFVIVSGAGVEEAGICGNNGTLDGNFFYIGASSP